MGPNPKERQALLTRMAAVFYGTMILVAFAWAGFAGRHPGWVGSAPTLADVVLWAVIGVAFGLLVVALSSLSIGFRAMQEMAHVFRTVLGPIGWGQAFLLALLSGVGEELLFRGAIQPTLGLFVTSLLFGLVHWPAQRQLIAWTITAGVMGLAFGIGFELSGHVTGPVAAHFTVNFLNLRAIGKMDLR